MLTILQKHCPPHHPRLDFVTVIVLLCHCREEPSNLSSTRKCMHSPPLSDYLICYSYNHFSVDVKYEYGELQLLASIIIIHEVLINMLFNLYLSIDFGVLMESVY